MAAFRAYDFWKRRIGVGRIVSWDGYLGRVEAIPGPNVVRATFDLPAGKVLGISDVNAKYTVLRDDGDGEKK